ncbi:MAG: LysM peptidoglycan-binding domain-containing protein [Nocardioidaceae bacterium]
MTSSDPRRPAVPVVLVRFAVLLLLATSGSAVVAGVTRAAVEPARAAWATDGAVAFDDVVGAGAGLAVGGCWLWALATGLPYAVGTTRARLRGSRPTTGRLPVPRPVRLVVLLVLGAPGLALTGAGAASAGTVPPSPAVAPAARVAPPASLVPALLSGLPLPDRATGATRRTTPRGEPGPREVEVRPGDSLWRIAAREVAPPGSGPGAVAAATSRLRAANADRLGADPDLIFPGTRLVLPPAAPTREEHP